MIEDRFTPQALKLWKKVPEWAQEKLLDNVFCGNCLVMTTIVDFTGGVEGGDLVLRGKCKTCGEKVARLIESEGL